MGECMPCGNFKDLLSLRKHLLEHRKKGKKVPKRCLDRIDSEIREKKYREFNILPSIMKIKIRFKHNKKSKLRCISPATFHFDKDCSTGPVISKGKEYIVEYELKPNDLIEFSTTKYNDKFDLKIFRGKRLLNGSTPKVRKYVKCGMAFSI